MNPSFRQLAAFIRRYTHDLRNDLTGIELEAVLLATVFPDGEAGQIVNRLRAQIRKVVADLKDLAGHFAEPKPIRKPVAARELFELWEKQNEPGVPEISWTETVGDTRLNVDPSCLASVFKELVANAVEFGDGARIDAKATVEARQVVFSLREPKANPVEPEAWGRVPFVSTKPGGYGLGLWEADRVVKANGGLISRVYRDGHLITTLSFPIKSSAGKKRAAHSTGSEQPAEKRG